MLVAGFLASERRCSSALGLVDTPADGDRRGRSGALRRLDDHRALPLARPRTRGRRPVWRTRSSSGSSSAPWQRSWRNGGPSGRRRGRRLARRGRLDGSWPRGRRGAGRLPRGTTRPVLGARRASCTLTSGISGSRRRRSSTSSAGSTPASAASRTSSTRTIHRSTRPARRSSSTPSAAQRRSSSPASTGYSPRRTSGQSPGSSLHACGRRSFGPLALLALAPRFGSLVGSSLADEPLALLIGLAGLTGLVWLLDDDPRYAVLSRPLSRGRDRDQERRLDARARDRRRAGCWRAGRRHVRGIVGLAGGIVVVYGVWRIWLNRHSVPQNPFYDLERHLRPGLPARAARPARVRARRAPRSARHAVAVAAACPGDSGACAARRSADARDLGLRPHRCRPRSDRLLRSCTGSAESTCTSTSTTPSIACLRSSQSSAARSYRCSWASPIRHRPPIGRRREEPSPWRRRRRRRRRGNGHPRRGRARSCAHR